MSSNRQTDSVAAQLISEAREAILWALSEKPCLLILYGSEARGEATAESDIDLLVVLEQADRESVDRVHGAVYDVMWKHDFIRLISPFVMSRSDYEEQRRKGYSFIRNVENDGIVLWKAA